MSPFQGCGWILQHHIPSIGIYIHNHFINNKRSEIGDGLPMWIPHEGGLELWNQQRMGGTNLQEQMQTQHGDKEHQTSMKSQGDTGHGGSRMRTG